MMRIPNSLPWITDHELLAVTAFLRKGNIGSNAENLRTAEAALCSLIGADRVLLTPSCTLALELAMRSLSVGPGDEVIVPSFTFTATANAVLQCGALPVLVDIEDHTLCLDIASAEAACSRRTRAIIPVHYAGIACDMDRLLAFARARGVHIVEDAAHALGARSKGKPLGTLGTFGCFSFHDTKNCTSGEGGALIINDPRFIERAERIYEHGTNRRNFTRGEVDAYTWVSPGGSYTMSGILAALLAAQLARYEDILRGRQRVTRRYRAELAPLVDEGLIRFTDVPDGAMPNEHLAFFLMQEPERRDALLAHLRNHGIEASFHYIPLHLSPFARTHLGTRPGQFPVSERIAASIVRLPLFPQMSESDCTYVIENVHDFFHPAHTTAGILNAWPFPSSVNANEEYDLSLVIPCYQEQGHLTENLNMILRTLDQSTLRYEIILVDDASTDGTDEMIRTYVAAHPRHPLRALFHGKNCGRGASVRDGFLIARGRFVGFIDVDLEVDIQYLSSALHPLFSGEADMVIGNRRYAFCLSTLPRYLATKGYRFLVRWMLGLPSLDTESGFKFFRRDRIIPLLAGIRDERWFWDTEVTVRSYDAGLRIHAEPVEFRRKPEKKSTVRLFRDSCRSFVCLFRFARERARHASSGSDARAIHMAVQTGRTTSTVRPAFRSSDTKEARVCALPTGGRSKT